ncbi:unnamed protein product [Linum trigynum]|uniref:Uncharacterized protein n=1 Tax=Linum trigynum TaxID=586398 RepID=A0AAV2DZN7_9ROSI
MSTTGRFRSNATSMLRLSREALRRLEILTTEIHVRRESRRQRFRPSGDSSEHTSNPSDRDESSPPIDLKLVAYLEVFSTSGMCVSSFKFPIDDSVGGIVHRKSGGS